MGGFMNSRLSIPILSLTVSLFVALSVHDVTAQKKYDMGASDTEIRIGNTIPYTGPASAFATIGKTVQFLSNVSSSAGSVLVPAGIENSRGVITAGYIKDPSDPQWKDDEQGESGTIRSRPGQPR